MLKINTKYWMLPTACLLIFVLAGCHAKPYDYEPTAGEMKPGPGVFTGESGELKLYDANKGGLLQKGSAETSNEKTTNVSAKETAVVDTQTGKEPTITPEEAIEFQQFQQWKKEKEQFHEYQQWKKSEKGSAEFKEFQEYREWQKKDKSSAEFRDFQGWKEFKAYQQWKKSQEK